MENVAVDEQKLASPVNGDKADEKSPEVFRPVSNPAKADDDADAATTAAAANGADLSPPDSSSVSSVNPDMLGDEIIVGTHGNGDKPSPLRVVSDAEDGDATNGEDEEPVSHYPKRKRASLYNDLGEDKMETTLADETNGISTPRGSQGKATPSNPRDLKGVVIGYWRDSPIPNPIQKHAVIGFMDVRDRLRTRIQVTTRSGEMINIRLFPVPPGPGGSWVTFERIVFDDHLIGLDHNEIKEYVKIRSDASGNEAAEAREESERLAVKEARRRVEATPAAETAQPPSIAYGLEIPDNAQIGRHEAKRRRLASSAGVLPERPSNLLPGQMHPPVSNSAPSPSPATLGAPYPGMLDSLPGTRPTRILVGCWSKSAVDSDRDRHAVYGILGANDMFRVKLVRETLDGRYIDGNFPAGAGALWIPYEEVIFLRHIAHLSRPEMKEYVRVRQSQIDGGEKEDEKVSNETKAVYEAQTRVAFVNRGQSSSGNAMPRHVIAGEREEAQDHANGPPNSGGHELRHHRREVMLRAEAPMPRQPLPEPEMRHLTAPPSVDPVDRVQGLASREVARMEAVQMRHDRQHQSRFAMPPGAVESVDHHRHNFQENRDRMQKIWVSQEQNRIRAGAEDAKMYMGIKYERKQNGPFAGKLVSQGAILTIDGEDYVEYRVLTKPSFF
ncbi:hypothetical protein SAMD00023353_6800140 [Rosellinia necatrix]|uniref:tRNA splicing endonuclease subunit n=1 Tax=Rosellinia necatrix TaxID=77044 RepID=A0A1W2TWQ7_ROSNE|nr:hypothetical protein SAMD00023353_6800140 [Rosellinia necatrix]